MNFTTKYTTGALFVSAGQGSEAVYARECFPVPGFSVSFTDPDAKRTEFGDYRSLCARWQNNVTLGLRAALQSKNYVQIRNALLILNTTVKARSFTLADDHVYLLLHASL